MRVDKDGNITFDAPPTHPRTIRRMIFEACILHRQAKKPSDLKKLGQLLETINIFVVQGYDLDSPLDEVIEKSPRLQDIPAYTRLILNA